MLNSSQRITNTSIVIFNYGYFAFACNFGLQDFLATRSSWCGTCTVEGLLSGLFFFGTCVALTATLALGIEDSPKTSRIAVIPTIFSIALICILLLGTLIKS